MRFLKLFRHLRRMLPIAQERRVDERDAAGASSNDAPSDECILPSDSEKRIIRQRQNKRLEAGAKRDARSVTCDRSVESGSLGEPGYLLEKLKTAPRPEPLSHWTRLLVNKVGVTNGSSSFRMSV